MAKLYTKGTTVVDEILTGAERYNILEDGGGAFKSTMQINLATGVTQAGTVINAARLNNIEDGVDALDTLLDAVNKIQFTGAHVSAETLSANKTLTDADSPIVTYIASGADRDVTLPAVASGNHAFVIINRTTTLYSIIVKNAGGTVISTLRPGASELFVADVYGWYCASGFSRFGGTITGVLDAVQLNVLKLAGQTADLAHFGDATDYMAVEADGTLRFGGAATFWKDIDFPIIIRATGTNVPTITTLNGNLTAPQWAVNDYVMGESQEFIHEWKELSPGYWHIHLTTNGLDATNRYVRFELEFGYATPSGVWIFPATIDSGNLLIPANTTTKTMFILSLGSFTPAAGTHIGGHIIARLKRIAATGTAPTANPWVPMLQLHVECDTLGSRSISTK